MKHFTNTIFFPAISIATHTTIMKKDWKVNGKSPRFYLNGMTEATQMFHHPYILTSAAHNYKDMDFMKSIGINNKATDTNMIFGDSGGFQIATGELKETPELIEKLYSWMENNATVSPIIDCPPWSSQAAAITQSEMDSSIARTKKNVDLLKSRPQNTNFTWLNVVHGRKYDQRVYWYNKVKDFNLQGWALGSLRKNTYDILAAFASLLDNGELANQERCQLIHFFGFTAARYIPYIIYLKYKLNEANYKVNISFDSSYATQNGGWGKYLIYPSSTGFMSYHLSNRFVGQFKDVEMPCSCPVCKNVRLIDVLNEKALTNDGESYFYNVVQSHNVYMLNEYVKMLHSLIYTGNSGLWETAFKSHQTRVFKVIDKMFEAKSGKSINILENNVGVLNKSDDDGGSDELDPEFLSMFGSGAA